MNTKRNAIETLRNKLRERNADSNYTNQFLYSVLMEHAKWLIKREISAGRVYKNNSLFQTLGCQEVVEVSTIDECCPVNNNCKIYKTKNQLPDMWIDNNGPVIRRITSIDGSTEFFLIGAQQWHNKKNNPYQRMIDKKYAIFENNHLWFPDFNPHLVNINGFYVDDISLIENKCDSCKDEKQPCIRFLDTKLMLPDWVEAEMSAKALEQLAGISKRLQEDEQIDKNPTRKS